MSVSGKFAPETLNPVPLTTADVMVTASVPVEVNVTGSVDVVPVVTSPKLKLVGLTINCGVVVITAVPVPLKLTTTVAPLDALLLSVSVPVTALAVVGENCTLSVAV